MTAPAAGGGDTRDGREAERRAQLYEGYLATDAARPAAAPADDTGELREAITEALGNSTVVVVGYEVRTPMTADGLLGMESARELADAVLALPAARALIDGAHTDRARITAVEALAVQWDEMSADHRAQGATNTAMVYTAHARWIRRALGGER